MYDIRGIPVELTLPPPGEIGSLDRNVILAVHEGKRLKLDPRIVKAPPPPRALYATTNTSETTLTAGDQIYIFVHFDAAVFVYCAAATWKSESDSRGCPSLVLQTIDGHVHAQSNPEWINWTAMRRAMYCGGNGTAILSFR